MGAGVKLNQEQAKGEDQAKLYMSVKSPQMNVLYKLNTMEMQE